MFSGYVLGAFGHVASRQDRDFYDLELIDLEGDSLHAIFRDSLARSRLAGVAGIAIGLAPEIQAVDSHDHLFIARPLNARK